MYKPQTFFLLVILVSCNRIKKVEEIPVVSADSLIRVFRYNVADGFRSNRPERSIAYLDSIRPFVDKLNQPIISSAWLAYRATIFVGIEKKDSARYYLDKALAMAASDTSRKAIVIPKIQYVTFLVQQEVFDTALQHALEAQQLSKIAAPPELPLLYSQLAFLYKIKGDKGSQRKYLFEGLDMAKEPQHVLVLASDIGRYYADNQQIDSAIYFYNHFLSRIKSSNPFLLAWKYDDLGALLLANHRPREALMSLQMAANLYKKFDKISEGIYFSLARAAEETDNTVARDLYLDTATTIARQHRNLSLLADIFSKKAKIERARHQYAAAYKALDSSHVYHEKNDSLAFQDKSREIEETIVRKAKDEQIAAMKFEVDAGKKIIRQRQVIIIVLILGALFLTGFGILLFRRRQMQVQLREAELHQEALLRQMQPHFVFNTLGVLQSFIRNDHPDKAIEYLSKFSSLLRMNLENSRQSFVPLEDELMVLTSYLRLSQMNMENAFEYKLDVDDSNDDIYIPPMLLQPFVENSILHGFSNISYKGIVIISIQKNKDVLHCIIDDNGIGIQATTGKSKRSYATTITRDRLDLLRLQTGRSAEITIIDKQSVGDGQGVRVILDIPYRLAHNAKAS